MIYDDSGTMTFRTFTAGGALPVEKTVIKISGADENNGFVEFSLITDKNGITEKISLPSPSSRYSLSPNADEAPYALYNIVATADGYYTKKVFNVAIFPNTDSFQPINMIPIAIYKNGVEYPIDTLETTVSENPFLER